MMRRDFAILLCAFCALCGSVAFAQNYQCNWSVAGIGGGSMSSTSYRSDATAGQTAIGQIAGTAYQAFIGFWQIDTTITGIKDEAHGTAVEPLVTRLFAPYPNPSRDRCRIRYSLATEGYVELNVCDLVGRNVRTLVSARQKPGRYSFPFAARLSAGVYFVRLTANGVNSTRKLIVE